MRATLWERFAHPKGVARSRVLALGGSDGGTPSTS